MENHAERLKKAIPKNEVGYSLFELASEAIPPIKLLKIAGDIIYKCDERLLYKKLIRFFSAINNSSSLNAKEKFAKKLEDKDFCEKVGDKLLLIIRRFDSEEKAELCGRAFELYLEGDTLYLDSINVFWEIAYALDICFFDDLKLLKDSLGPNNRNKFITSKEMSESTISRLIGAGIYATNHNRSGFYSLTMIGRLIRHLVDGTEISNAP